MWYECLYGNDGETRRYTPLPVDVNSGVYIGPLLNVVNSSDGEISGLIAQDMGGGNCVVHNRLRHDGQLCSFYEGGAVRGEYGDWMIIRYAAGVVIEFASNEPCRTHCDDVYCPSCGGRWRREGDSPHGPLCPSCREEGIAICVRCGEVIDSDEVVIYDGNPFHERCAVRADDNTPEMQGWHASPRPFVPITGGNQLIGFELEVTRKPDRVGKYEWKRDIIRHLKESDGMSRLIYEYDSTVSKGFEIISRPFSSGYVPAMAELLDTSQTYLRSVEWDSSDELHCGLHFHMSKTWWKSTSGLARLLFTASKFREVMFSLSRRARSNWDLWSTIPEDMPGTVAEIENEIFSGAYKEHHLAISLGHKETVEFRMFGGTLNIDEFLGGLDFVRFLTDFSNGTSQRRIERMSERDFVKEAEEYSKNLSSYINTLPKVA